MRRLVLSLGVLGLMAFGARFAAAQEVGSKITLTGCLARENDEADEADEPEEPEEFLLQHVADEKLKATEIELIAGEGVDLAEHVGHTVQVTGVVIADDDEGEEAEAGEHETQEESEMELHIRVTGLKHLAATCHAGTTLLRLSLLSLPEPSDLGPISAF